MKELTLSTLLAVFEELFGAWLFWGLVAIALAVTMALVIVLVRERRLQDAPADPFRANRHRGRDCCGLAGPVRDELPTSGIGGPIDAIIIIGIWVAGAAGTLVAIYAAMGVVSGQMGWTET